MPRLLTIGYSGLTSGMLLSTGILAEAATVSFLVDRKISDDTVPIVFKVTLSDITGGVTVNLGVDSSSSNTGDILGAFFDLKGLVNPQPTVTGTLVKTVKYNVNAIPPGNIVTPAEPFDVGITFGTVGRSSDFITATDFNVVGVTVNSFLGQRFAVRAQSSGSIPDGGNGSTKMIGLVPPNSNQPILEIPEPSMILGLGIIALAGGIFKKNTKNK